jgi:hypothetical protein
VDVTTPRELRGLLAQLRAEARRDDVEWGVAAWLLDMLGQSGRVAEPAVVDGGAALLKMAAGREPWSDDRARRAIDALGFDEDDLAELRRVMEPAHDDPMHAALRHRLGWLADVAARDEVVMPDLPRKQIPPMRLRPRP